MKNHEDKYHVFDIIRKKFIILTPEEWVRQSFIHYLCQYHHYPKGLIKVEGGLKYNKLFKRTDILVHDHSGNPYLLIECKSYEIKLGQKTIEQAAIYNQKLNADYLLVTNGLKHFCFHKNPENDQYERYESIPEAPRG